MIITLDSTMLPSGGHVMHSIRKSTRGRDSLLGEDSTFNDSIALKQPLVYLSMLSQVKMTQNGQTLELLEQTGR